MLWVLFVCTGNICRSPLAEAFLNARSERLLGGEVRVSSAGTWGREGHPPTRETVAAGAEYGLDVSLHEASPLLADRIEQADLVLGLTAEHKDEVLRMSPEAAPKVFTLKELTALLRALDGPATGPGRDDVLARVGEAHVLRSGRERPRIPDLDVSDPMGLGIDVYRAIAAEIEEAVDGLVRDLFGVRLPAPAREA